MKNCLMNIYLFFADSVERGLSSLRKGSGPAARKCRQKRPAQRWNYLVPN